jgi:hypothetical protein
MATITYPTSNLFIKPQAFEFGLKFNTLVHTSPLTGYVQTVGLTGARWVASITYPSTNAANAASLDAFVVSLKGQQNRVTMHNLARPNVLGSGSGTPIVNGANQTGASVITSGWSANQVVLKAGDMIGVGGELKMVTSDVTSSGAGAATIFFQPEIRNSPTNSSPIILDKPTALFMLTENEIRSRRTQAIFEPLTIEMVEVFA